MIERTVQRVEAGGNLSMDQMSEAVGLIMQGACAEPVIARFLLALRKKRESVAEVAGAALALRKYMTPIRTSRTGILDTCGTGGDGSMTFNISTTAALVAAGAGVPVAKHGNVSVTSRSGSADVLAALGVNISAPLPKVEACLEEIGFCFCYAPLWHPAMRNVAAIRKKLGVPTIFNILGPLANPAGAPFQLLGVGREDLQPLMSQAMGMLGAERAVVVFGGDGLDEVTLAEATHVTETTPRQVRRLVWDPADFDLDPVGLETLLVRNPQESAEIVRKVLGGEAGPARDIVVANAAAALWTAGRDKSLRQCSHLAQDSIDSGAAREVLAKLIEKTRA